MTFSASLAAAIGLEEAIALSWMNDVALCSGGSQWQVPAVQVRQAFSFWDDQRIRLVIRSLVEKGLIHLEGPLFPEGHVLAFHFGVVTGTKAIESQVTATQTHHSQEPHAGYQVSAPAGMHKPLNDRWQPSRDALSRLGQHGIPESYSLSLLDEFILKGREQGQNRNDWDTSFFRFVKNKWVYTRNEAHKRQQRLAEKAAFSTAGPDRHERFSAVANEASPITGQWQPSQDVFQILQRDHVEAQFITESVPEFVLYWQERGDAHKTWNTKFIQHVRQQWARYSASLEHATVPTRITDNWQPDNDCYDILSMAHIDVQFARNLVPEFVLYWRDSNQLQTSWNSRFLQYVKQQWARQLNQGATDHAGQQRPRAGSEQGHSTATATLDQLLDNNW